MANIGVTVHLEEEDELAAHRMEVGEQKRIVHVLALGEVSVFLSLEQMQTIEESIHSYLEPGHHRVEPTSN